jgi:hypothetical protein
VVATREFPGVEQNNSQTPSDFTTQPWYADAPLGGGPGFSTGNTKGGELGSYLLITARRLVQLGCATESSYDCDITLATATTTPPAASANVMEMAMIVEVDINTMGDILRYISYEGNSFSLLVYTPSNEVIGASDKKLQVLSRQNDYLLELSACSVLPLCAALCCATLRCATLLCAALHCTSLICTALRCFALFCAVLRCFALLCAALRCFAVLVLRCAVLLCAALLYYVLPCAALRCSALFFAALCCASLCCAALHCSDLRSFADMHGAAKRCATLLCAALCCSAHSLLVCVAFC